MTKFIEDSKFFFTSYHTGVVNILFHVFSIFLMFYGLLHKSWLLALIGIAVFDELGHIYNYFFPHKNDPLWNPVRMLVCQAVYVVPVGVILFKVFGLF